MKVKLKYKGRGKQRVPGVGDFVKGTIRDVDARVADPFRNLPGWSVINPEAEKGLKKGQKMNPKPVGG